MRLAAILLILASFQVINGQSQKPHACTDKKNAQGSQATSTPPPAAPVVTEIKQQGPSPQGNSAKDHPESYFRRLFAPENIPNIVLASVGIVGIIVAICTLGVIKRQTTAIEQQSQTAASSLELLRRETDFIVAQNRAWLVVSIEGEPGNRQKAEGAMVAVGYCFHWKIKNCGGSPAFIVRMGARWHPVRAFEELPPEPDIESVKLMQATAHYPFGLSIGPGESIDRYTIGDDYPNKEEISQGRTIHLAYGVVEYRTAYESSKIMETRFCYRLNVAEWETLAPSELPMGYTKQT